MARLENQTLPMHFRSIAFNASGTIHGEAINASAGVLHSVIIGSHTAGKFKLWNSATGPGNPIMGTYIVPSGAQTINFAVPIEFSGGLWVTTAPIRAFAGDGTATDQSGITFLYN